MTGPAGRAPPVARGAAPWPPARPARRDAAAIGIGELAALLEVAPPADAWLDTVSFPVRVLRRGELACREGEPFRLVYPVLSGCLKASSVSACGREQLQGLLLRGDVAGMDSAGRAQHRSTLVAVEPTRVAVVGFAAWRKLARECCEVDAMLLRAFAAEIDRGLTLNRLLGVATVRGRLALLLLWLARRRAGRGAAGDWLRLPVSRLDIAGLLGTTQETVSRAFSGFAAAALIRAGRGTLCILDPAGLAALAAAPARRPASPQVAGVRGASAAVRRVGGERAARPAAIA